MDPKLEKWLRWIDVIKDEVQELVIAKHVFHRVQEMIRDNSKLHQTSTFYDYFARTYVSHIVMGVRRQIKYDNESISLVRLLGEMIEAPEKVSRTFYTDKYKGSAAQMFADRDFEKFAAPGAKHIDPKLMQDDVARLRAASKRCEGFADRRVAHRDARSLNEIPTFNEVDECVALLDELCVKYYQLFHGSAPESLLPTWQYDWEAIFRTAWIPPHEEI